MKKKYITLLLIILFAIPAVSFGHPGNTDENGGHNSGTGYHYHHGYPAHQHINGQCPYDFDDKTGWNSGSNSENNSAKNENSTSIKTSIEESKIKKEEPIKKFFGYLSFWSVIGLAWVFAFCGAQALISGLTNLLKKDIADVQLYSFSLLLSLIITYWLQNKFGFADMFNHYALIIFFLPAGIVAGGFLISILFLIFSSLFKKQ